jgi:epoxyqueuosine reductase QueG
MVRAPQCQVSEDERTDVAGNMPDDDVVVYAAALSKDAATLARELLAISHVSFSAAFKGSPMKRAKLRGLKGNAATVLGNVGAREEVDMLTRALEDDRGYVSER